MKNMTNKRVKENRNKHQSRNERQRQRQTKPSQMKNQTTLTQLQFRQAFARRETWKNDVKGQIESTKNKRKMATNILF